MRKTFNRVNHSRFKMLDHRTSQMRFCTRKTRFLLPIITHHCLIVRAKIRRVNHFSQSVKIVKDFFKSSTLTWETAMTCHGVTHTALATILFWKWTSKFSLSYSFIEWIRLNVFQSQLIRRTLTNSYGEKRPKQLFPRRKAKGVRSSLITTLIWLTQKPKFSRNPLLKVKTMT